MAGGKEDGGGAEYVDGGEWKGVVSQKRGMLAVGLVRRDGKIVVDEWGGEGREDIETPNGWRYP